MRVSILHVSSFFFVLILSILGLNILTGWNGTLANWVISNLDLWRTACIYLTYVSACVLACTMGGQFYDLNDPTDLPFILKVQAVSLVFVFFVIGVYTLFVYSYWSLFLWVVMESVALVYRYTIPKEYDAFIEEYCLIAIELFSRSVVILTLILFFF